MSDDGAPGLCLIRDLSAGELWRRRLDVVWLRCAWVVREADAVDAVSIVRWHREALILKDMSQVTLARAAHNLHTRAVGVRTLLDRARHTVVEGWPPASAVKLVLGVVEWCGAADAEVRALGRILGLVLLLELEL